MMNVFLLKRLAVALTVSQIFTQPEVKDQFNPQSDQQQVIEIMNKGCTQIVNDLSVELPELKDLDVEQLLEQIITNARESHQKLSLVSGLDLNEAKAAYRLFCKGQKSDGTNIDVSELINYYNGALNNLPDPKQLKRPASSRIQHRTRWDRPPLHGSLSRQQPPKIRFAQSNSALRATSLRGRRR